MLKNKEKIDKHFLVACHHVLYAYSYYTQRALFQNEIYTIGMKKNKGKKLLYYKMLLAWQQRLLKTFYYSYESLRLSQCPSVTQDKIYFNFEISPEGFFAVWMKSFWLSW